MNANRLARMYDRLTVWERIPLLIAADARGDDTEYQRLLDTSPPRAWHFSEHLLAEQALHLLAMTYIVEQLDAAASYFFALFQLGNDPQPEHWLLPAESAAYFFTANAAAWRRFCADLDIAPNVLTTANHHGWLLPFCEERMPSNAPSAEALRARLQKAGFDAARLVMTKSLLAGWRDALRAMTRHAPPPIAKEEEP
jgi:hypothetical protein